MRVISGMKRGMRLINPENSSVRPTSDKVKEALFDMIAFDISGSKVLDLFAGTGALGIEALSRDAAYCVFVDRSKKSIELIDKNLNKAKLNQSDCSMVLNMDFSAALMYLKQKNIIFDLVFIDPPYHDDLYDKSLRLLTDYRLIRDKGKVIIEMSTDVKIDDVKYGLTCYKVKKYGNTVIKFYTGENA